MPNAVFIRTDGSVQFVYSDDLADALRPLGPQTVTRASHVEPDASGGWTADMSLLAPGVVLGPFPRRDEALAAEAAWLDEFLSKGVRMNLSWDLKRLLMAEIENEADGGEVPSTLRSCLESLQCGYAPFDGFPVSTVEAELKDLIAVHDRERSVRDLVSSADWARRAALPVASPP
jgi:hypothetical protein